MTDKNHKRGVTYSGTKIQVAVPDVPRPTRPFRPTNHSRLRDEVRRSRSSPPTQEGRTPTEYLLRSKSRSHSRCKTMENVRPCRPISSSPTEASVVVHQREGRYLKYAKPGSTPYRVR